MRSTKHCPPVRPVAVVLVSIASVSSAVILGTHPWSSGEVNPRPPLSTSSARPEEGPALLAVEAAIALNAIDYRDPVAWLEALRPISTDRAFEMLKVLYVPLVWEALEQEQRVVTRDAVSAKELGLLAAGSDWQARLVTVEIRVSPSQSQSAVFQMRLLLRCEADGWKLDGLLSESEAEVLSGNATVEDP